VSSHAFEFTNPLIVALDVDRAEDCLDLAALLKGRVGAFKIGPRLTMRYGADLALKLAKFGHVFIDNKYLDIPNTMETAIRATFESGATLATVHAWAGREALERLAIVEAELNKQRPFKILAVTILTSFSQETLPPAVAMVPIQNQVADLATLVLNAGLSGLVCSPHELEVLRPKSSAFLVTPGVRLPSDEAGDQKRIETPAMAIRKGASALVVGRPICNAADPVAATEAVLASIREGRGR
jgi:orotidine-5'-phosphate decarboxylase